MRLNVVPVDPSRTCIMSFQRDVTTHPNHCHRFRIKCHDVFSSSFIRVIVTTCLILPINLFVHYILIFSMGFGISLGCCCSFFSPISRPFNFSILDSSPNPSLLSCHEKRCRACVSFSSTLLTRNIHRMPSHTTHFYYRLYNTHVKRIASCKPYKNHCMFFYMFSMILLELHTVGFPFNGIWGNLCRMTLPNKIIHRETYVEGNLFYYTFYFISSATTITKL